MLLLVFRVAGDAYAVEAIRVVRVVPCVELRALPHAPEGLAGLFRYRGRMVPVIDLGLVLGNRPSSPLLSTRIVLVGDRSPVRDEAVLGLIAEHVSDVRAVADSAIASPPSVLGRHPYLGPIASTETGLIPLIAVDRVLAEPLRQSPAEAVP
jgi:chemotaxis-related protein WspB